MLLEKENKASSVELDKALNAAKEMQTEIRSMREELQQADKIVAGGSYLLRTKLLDPKYAPLAGCLSPADAYADLANSTADAVKFFEGQGVWISFSGRSLMLPLARCR